MIPKLRSHCQNLWMATGNICDRLWQLAFVQEWMKIKFPNANTGLKALKFCTNINHAIHRSALSICDSSESHNQSNHYRSDVIIFIMKVCRAFMYSGVSFMTVQAVLVYLQGIVWSRIKEMNDQFLDVVISISIHGIHMTLSLFFIPMHNGKIYN